MALGANDDKIELEFAVTATGGDVARFARGYRLDAGYTLTFEIVSAKMVTGNGEDLCPGRQFCFRKREQQGRVLYLGKPGPKPAPQEHCIGQQPCKKHRCQVRLARGCLPTRAAGSLFRLPTSLCPIEKPQHGKLAKKPAGKADNHAGRSHQRRLHRRRLKPTRCCYRVSSATTWYCSNRRRIPSGAGRSPARRLL